MFKKNLRKSHLEFCLFFSKKFLLLCNFSVDDCGTDKNCAIVLLAIFFYLKMHRQERHDAIFLPSTVHAAQLHQRYFYLPLYLSSFFFPF